MKKTIILSLILSQLVFVLFLPVFLKLFRYLHPVVLFVVWMCVTFLASFIVFLIRKENVSVSYKLFMIFLSLYSACLLVLLFFRPSDQNYDNYNLFPFKTVLFYLSGEVSPFVAFYNLAANIGLFFPFGFWLSLTVLGRWQKITIPAIIILSIETAQLLLHRGSLDVDDLILNLLGIYLGYMMAPLIKKVIKIK